MRWDGLHYIISEHQVCFSGSTNDQNQNGVGLIIITRCANVFMLMTERILLLQQDTKPVQVNIILDLHLRLTDVMIRQRVFALTFCMKGNWPWKLPFSFVFILVSINLSWRYRICIIFGVDCYFHLRPPILAFLMFRVDLYFAINQLIIQRVYIISLRYFSYCFQLLARIQTEYLGLVVS